MKKDTSKLLTPVLKQYEVAVLAVYVLGGATKSIDTEDAAVQCHKMASSLFSWQKFKEQINLELVRVSLSDAKKIKNGRLLSGSGREGWRLSSRGLDWVRAREKLSGGFNSAELRRGHSKSGSIDSVRRERERLRILASDAWQEWKTDRTINIRSAQQTFRIDEYTTERMATIKVARLRALFEAKDELSEFLESASENVLKGKANER